ncbi:MAG: class I SAM-dependent methyltransferase [Candidatus Ochrobactrum gambitense]|nr:MAG: class I SAM-dependent methyltransferase [Candidatus Ochrobactrum gambitense]WEK16968.1 MAG: class I SAM-dependent methyltransferase [Candidatus Ochrobactrum gambitense]
MSNHFSSVQNLDATEWAIALSDPSAALKKYGILLPDLPPENIQLATAGASGLATLREASDFYHAVKASYERLGVDMAKARVIDFGSGWGRITRTFLKDVPSDNILGVDVRPDAVELAKSLASNLKFRTIQPTPPTGLPNNEFNLIVAYSVFSHLPENIASAWIKEFATLLKANGLLVITTRGRDHLVVSSKLRNHPDPKIASNPYGQMFKDFQSAISAYDRGEFVYSPTGGGKGLPSETYGEAIVPKDYIEKNWTDDFEMLDFVEAKSDTIKQPLIFLRRK